MDLSSSCGIAFCDIVPGEVAKDTLLVGGQWDLAISQHDTSAMRAIRLKAYLEALRPDFVAYEEIKHVGSANAPGMRRMNLTALVARAVSGARVVHELSIILTTWCEENDIPCEAVPVGTLKKYATQRGNANKEDMIRAANEQFGADLEVEDYDKTGSDNIADAMFLCAYGVECYGDT